MKRRRTRRTGCLATKKDAIAQRGKNSHFLVESAVGPRTVAEALEAGTDWSELQGLELKASARAQGWNKSKWKEQVATVQKVSVVATTSLNAAPGEK